VRVDVLRGKSREHQVAWARQVAMYLLREETSASLHQIGDQLGGRDHTTIMHGCARITKALKEPRTIQDLAAIRTALHG
jgi:chromosomal replication initiator protein